MVKSKDMRGQHSSLVPKPYSGNSKPWISPEAVLPPLPRNPVDAVPPRTQAATTGPIVDLDSIEPVIEYPFGARVLPYWAMASLRARDYFMADLVAAPVIAPEGATAKREYGVASDNYDYLRGQYGAQKVAAVALSAEQAQTETDGSQFLPAGNFLLGYLVQIVDQGAATGAGDVAA